TQTERFLLYGSLFAGLILIILLLVMAFVCKRQRTNSSLNDSPKVHDDTSDKTVTEWLSSKYTYDDLRDSNVKERELLTVDNPHTTTVSTPKFQVGSDIFYRTPSSKGQTTHRTNGTYYRQYYGGDNEDEQYDSMHGDKFLFSTVV
ncbi:unnamed protein product, partial [Didymodactylos carnosus]